MEKYFCAFFLLILFILSLLLGILMLIPLMALGLINMTNPSVLMKENSELIAVHEGKYFKRGDGLAVGPGCFTRGLEYATGKTATVIGKFAACTKYFYFFCFLLTRHFH